MARMRVADVIVEKLQAAGVKIAGVFITPTDLKTDGVREISGALNALLADVFARRGV